NPLLSTHSRGVPRDGGNLRLAPIAGNSTETLPIFLRQRVARIHCCPGRRRSLDRRGNALSLDAFVCASGRDILEFIGPATRPADDDSLDAIAPADAKGQRQL